MTTRVFTDPRSQHFKSDGVSINSSGKLYFREPGSGSTTLKSVYSDKGLTTPLINPVILDANGRAPTIFMNGDYNIQMTDSADVQIWRVDYYEPPTVDGQFDAWDSTLTYAVNDYVRYTNGLYYISLQSGNTGNVPNSSPAYWSQAFFLTVYNSSTTYAADDVVYYDGNIYTSLQGSNTGNTPDTSTSYWKRPGVSVPAVSGYQGYVINYIRSGGAFSSFNVAGNVTDGGLQETIGPTGSGADHIWTALDSLPTNAVGLRIHASATATRTTGSSDTYSVFLGVTESGVTNPVTCSILGYGSSTEPSRGAAVNEVEVLVDANNVFSATWQTDNVDTSTGVIYLTGFLVEEL